jgi:hypothetical protein
MKRVLVATVVGLTLLGATAASAGPSGIKLQPQAGNFRSGDYHPTGNSTYSQAQWTNKVALDGKFSVLLQKSVDESTCFTLAEQPGSCAYAAAIVNGVEGLTVAQLGSIGFSEMGNCGGGSPRFSLAYDNDGDGQVDGLATYGCANHPAPPPAPGWFSMVADPSAPDSCFSIDSDGNIGPCTMTPASVVLQLAVLIDEDGTWYIDRVQAAGQTTGEPNGGN